MVYWFRDDYSDVAASLARFGTLLIRKGPVLAVHHAAIVLPILAFVTFVVVNRGIVLGM
jgi:hypothetical protein